MDEANCIRCHSPLEIVGIRDGRAFALLCTYCDTVWQIDAGWNRWTERFDEDLLKPPFGYV